MNPNDRGSPSRGDGSNTSLLVGALIVVLAVIGYFIWAGGYWGGHPAGNSVTAQTPTRQPVAPQTTPNVTPNKPVNNTPATNSPRPQ